MKNDQKSQENHYGDFYGKRATYYVIESPENRLYNAQVNNIILYFLDGELAKTRYDLNQDIANRLIAELGKFNIRWKDTVDRDIMRNVPVITRSKDSIRINEQLRNFEMIWRKDEKHIRYEVRKTDSTELFTYSEMKTDYLDNLFEIKTGD